MKSSMNLEKTGTMLRQTLFVAIMASLLISTMVSSQTGPAEGDVTWDLGIEVPGQEKTFDRITGKASVISGSRLSFPDGCKVRLYGVETPKPDEPFGKEAAEFLGSLIKDQVISCIIQDSAGASCHAGETNLSETMLIHGWGKALHDSLVPAEIIAIDHKRGIWRGKSIRLDVAVQEAIDETMIQVRQAVDEHGVTDAAIQQIQMALSQLAQTPGLKERPDLSGLHGSATTKAVVLASEGDEGLTLILARFAPDAPTPIHDHGTWAVAHVFEGRDHYIRWERLDDGSDPERAEVRVKHEKVLGPGDSVYWYGPPHDIHSQQAKDGPAWELVLAGKNMMRTTRHYFDRDTGRVTEQKPQ